MRNLQIEDACDVFRFNQINSQDMKSQEIILLFFI